MQHPALSFTQSADTALITLQRPDVLNALNLSMVRKITQNLTAWEADPGISQVFISSSNDKAFCAGGDLREVYTMRLNPRPEIAAYFTEVYYLNKLIKNYKKPFIAVINGIAMGGGLGIALHGSLRIALNNLVLAMPETSIGYFTDIGATYFLSRCLGEIGIYLALTSTRINALEAHYAGLIDQIIGTPPADNHLADMQAFIDSCFAYDSVEEIVSALITLHKKHVVGPVRDWSKKCLDQLNQRCPESLILTLAALRLAKFSDFETCMRREYQLCLYFIENKNFYEGIRAAVIDKDHQPVWSPAKLSEVNKEILNVLK